MSLNRIFYDLFYASFVDDYYLSICEQVMRESGAMDQTIMHCIFVGPAGVGKSSLLKRLLRIKLDPKRNSTQAVEKSIRVEVIRDVSRTAARMSGLDWKRIDDLNSQASGLVGQLSTKKEDSIASRPNTHLSTMHEEAMQEENDSLVADPGKLVYEQTGNTSETKELSENTVSKSPESKPLTHFEFSKTINFFRHALKEKGVSELKQHVNSSTLYLTDSGGQPEFQELLPALVVGPCVFFVVFPLNKSLNEKYDVEYVKLDGQKCIKKYSSSLTVQEDILRSLASIASTKYKDKDGNDVKPRVMLVATFKDKVPVEVRQKRLKELQGLIRKTDAYRQGMIVDAAETQMVFTINNVSNEEAEEASKEIRDAFQIIADGFKVRTPSPWLIFGILVQHVHANDSVISKQQCFKVAKECGIRSELEFEAALQFLHKQTGILHYYMEPPELSTVVIRNPQHLFSQVNQLVETTFTFEGTRSSQCTEAFKRGIFDQTDYEALTKGSRSKLNPSMLLKLLKHLNVIVPLGDGKKYFMPCAIAHLDEDTNNCRTKLATIPPLLITFKSGYCPIGLFGALVACITNKQVAKCTLTLDESQIYRDQICFQMGLYKLLLQINPTYIYIEVIPKNDILFSTEICLLCNSVCNLIEESITKAYETLHYSDSHCLSFVCQCVHGQVGKLHHAHLRNDPVQGHYFLCSQSKEKAPVNPECHVWLPEVSRKLNYKCLMFK